MNFLIVHITDIITRTLQPLLAPIVADQQEMARTLCKIERLIKLPQPYAPPHATQKRTKQSNAQRFLDFSKEYS